MKSRKGLLFALCAMAGFAGFAGCADDNSEVPDTAKLTVSPSSKTVNQAEVVDLEVSYEANKKVSAVSDNTSCVTVASDIILGADGKGVVKATAVGNNCSAKISVKDGEKSAEATITVNPAAAGAILVLSGDIELEAGQKKNENVTYKASDGTALDKGLVIENNNKACVVVPSSVETSGGKASFEVIAQDVANNCEATITVTGEGVSEKFKVSVTAAQSEDPVKPEPDKPTVLSFSAKELAISGDNHNGENVTIKYAYADGGPLVDYKINVTSSNSTCAKFTPDNGYKTDAYGEVAGKIVPVGQECETTITATQGKAKAELVVTVSEKTIISIKNLEILANSKYDKMGYAGFAFNTVGCDVVLGDISTYADFHAAADTAEKDGSDPTVKIFYPDEVSVDFTSIDVTSTKSVVGFAAASMQDQDDILGFGCHDFVMSDNGKAVKVELDPVPTNIKGKYKVVSNFDLTSGFDKTPCDKDSSYKGLGICVPKVEAMKPGDWVKFITDFCKEPLVTLLEFAWSNTIERLNDIKDENGESKLPSWLTSFLLGSGAKMVALAALEPYLDGVLGSSGEWYKTLKTISPDVADLTTNMQLVGQFDITDVAGSTINKGTDAYNELQYQWSYNKNGCVADAYGKSSCRKSVKLSSGNGLAMAGNWNGNFKEDEESASLTINTHALDFKWATMLYVAVFGSILPDAMDYKVSNDLYMKAFLGKVLFESLVKAYNDQHANSKIALEAGKECNAFIEMLVYLIAANENEEVNSTVLSITKTAANMACADSVIGKLDDLLIGKDGVLNKFQASTSNGLNLSSKNCPLYDGGTSSFVKMGDVDEPVLTAEDVAGGKNTNRCKWDVDFSINDSPVQIKGIFHAERTDK